MTIVADPKGWLKEFYPVPAHLVKKVDAIAHSLQKWRGLRKGNLDKYGLDINNLPIVITGDTCALCQIYAVVEGNCNNCPIFSCDGSKVEDLESLELNPPPWWAWNGEHDPEPMIKVLEEALEEQELERQNAK